MAGRRRASRGGGGGRRRGRDAEELSEEEQNEEQVYQKRRVSDNVSADKDKTLFGSSSSQRRPPRQTTPQITRTLDDWEIFTSPPRHGTTVIRRFIDDEDVDTPREQQTEGTQTSGGNFTPILQTLDLLDKNPSESHVRAVSRTTLQPAEAPTAVQSPLSTNSVSHEANRKEKDVTVDDMNCALVTGGTAHRSSAQSQTVIPSLSETDELHLLLNSPDSPVGAFLRTLPTMSAPTSAPQKNASHSNGSRNMVLGNCNNDREESGSSCLLKSCHNHPSVPTLVPSNAHESLSRREDNVASSSINNGSKEMAVNNCAVSNRHEHQPCSSLNTTEIVELMGNGDFSEADSVASVNALFSVSNYKVKSQYVGPLTSILSKHGDIGANCSLGSVIFRSVCMELVCDIVEDLKKTNLKVITEKKLETMMASVTDLEKENIEVGWLRKRLEDISEAKKTVPRLHLHSECVSKAEVIKEQLEAYKREAEDLQKKINSAETDLSAVEIEASELKHSISEGKAKLKHVFKLESLAHDLV